MPGCVVPGCKARPELGYLLKRFPSEKRDKVRRREWIRKVGLPNWQPSNESRLCELHFEDDAWVHWNGERTDELTKEAVPTIFPWTIERFPRLRSPFKKIARAARIISPSPRKVARRVKLFHSYSKSPSKKPEWEVTEEGEDSDASCSPLSDNCSPPNIIRVRDIPGPSTSNEGTAATAPSQPSESEPTPQEPKPSSEHVTSPVRKSPSPRTKKLELYRCTCHEKQKMVKRLRVQLSRAQKKLIKMNKINRETKDRELLKKVYNEDQINFLSRKSKRIRKWSRATVKKAWKLRFSCGLRGYKELLAQGQPLPSSRTLCRRIEHLKFESGILHEVLDAMETKVQMMSEKERHCVLVLDEMSVVGNKEFDVSTGSFLGNVTLPEHSGIATHALVFMIAGINSRWKQAIAYYFTGDSTEGAVLKKIILELIQLSEKIKLKVMGVTSDQGGINQALWKAFEIECTRNSMKNKIPHPLDDKRELYFFPDVPHLLKNFRGMLTKHKIIGFDENIAKANGLPSIKANVEHLFKLCDYQADKELKAAHKLKKRYLEPSHFDKMSVFEAYQVLNSKVSSALELLVHEKKESEEMLTTAWLLRQVHHWFELMTSRNPTLALSLKKREVYDREILFLNDFIKLMKSLRFGVTQQRVWKPIQAGIILSTTSVLQIQERLLHKEGYEFLLTSRFTQDCLENLFSLVRSRQRAPSCLQFKRHLKVITVSQYVTPVHKSSYDQDDREFLGEFFEQKTEQNDKEVKAEEQELSKLKELLCGDYVKLDVGEENSLYHLAGYIVHSIKTLKMKRCKTCFDALLCTNDKEREELKPCNRLMSSNEYKKGALVAVNKKCFAMFQSLERKFRQSQIIFEDMPHLKKFLDENLLQEVNVFKFPECHQIKSKLVKRYITCRLRIHAQFQAPVGEKKDFSSKSGIIKSLIKKVGCHKNKI